MPWKGTPPVIAPPRSQFLRRSTAPVLAATVALCVALAGCSSGDTTNASDSSAKTSTTTVPSTTEFVEAFHPSLDHLLPMPRYSEPEQQIRQTGTVNLTDAVITSGYPVMSPGSTTLPPAATGWPVDNAKVRTFEDGILGVHWGCTWKATNPSIRTYDNEDVCNKGTYMIAMEQTQDPGSPLRIKTFEANLSAEIKGTEREPFHSRTWETVLDGDDDLKEVYIDGEREALIYAVQPAASGPDLSPLVYYLLPGSFDIHIGELVPYGDGTGGISTEPTTTATRSRVGGAAGMANDGF